MKKLKVLFLDWDVRYINPTRNNLVRLLQEICELYPFGPGYTSNEDLSKGVAFYIEKIGGVDLILASEHILFWGPDATVSKYRHYSFEFSQDSMDLTKGIQRYYSQADIPKLGLLAESDFWNFTLNKIEKLEECGGYYAGWGPEVVPRAEDLHEREPSEIPDCITNHWLDFVKRNPKNVFTFLHYLVPEEIVDTQLRERPKGWSVLGASYLSRRIARESLTSAQISWEGRRQILRMKILSRSMLYGLISRSWAIDKINSGFRRELRQCRYGYTCGAFIRGPIRKFFEIPAAGQVLVCEPFKGASDAGFLDRNTMIESDPEDILDVNEWLIRNPAEAQTIADAGRKMIRKNHSISARADQLRDVFNAIIEGHFNGGRWMGGEFKLL